MPLFRLGETTLGFPHLFISRSTQDASPQRQQTASESSQRGSIASYLSGIKSVVRYSLINRSSRVPLLWSVATKRS